MRRLVSLALLARPDWLDLPLPLRRLLPTLLLLVLLALGLVAAFWWWGRGVAGAGGVHQFAPTAVRAGAAFEIKVLASVWGQGRAPNARYRDWSLQLLQDGQPFGVPVAPARTTQEGDRLALHFQLMAPAPGDGPQPALTWQLRFIFDKQPRQVAGPHPISIGN